MGSRVKYVLQMIYVNNVQNDNLIDLLSVYKIWYIRCIFEREIVKCIIQA